MNCRYPGSLHNHTDFSNFRLRDCINRVSDLIDRAIELGHDCVAITDHETVAAAIRAEKYYDKVKEKHPDFKLILGNEIYLCRNGLNAENFNRETDKYYHFILLALDEIGHQQIREISTRAWMRAYMARGMMRVPTYYQDLFDVIGANPGHVVGSTACLGGALPTQLLKYRATKDEVLFEKIHIWAKQLNDLFGQGKFFFELQPSANDEQKYVNKMLIQLSEEMGIPFIITNDSHYLEKNDISIHKAFLNAQGGERETEQFYATTYLMSDEEIHSYLDKNIGVDNVQKAYENITKIKEMCKPYSLRKPLHIPRLTWKKPKPIMALDFWVNKIPSLRTFLDSEYEEDNLLAKLLMNKIEEDVTYQNDKTYDEVDACLKDTWESSEVNKARWSAYYLNLQNIIDTCWEANSLVGPGRGSGVGFILLNMLDITQINPLREKTATKRWRFLNPARVSVLDVDVDIEGGRRADVLKKFREVYGSDRVANVLTLGTEKSKSAILTAARGLGIDVDIASYLASMIVSDRGQLRTLSQTFYGDEENGWAPNKQFVNEMTENYPELWKVAQRIEGLICRTGIHAGGVIFVDEPFTNSTALMRAPSGEIITQFDLHDAEDASLIKYDVLSVEALDKIHNCLDLLVEYGYIKDEGSLKATYEATIGIYNLTREDPEMWKMCWEHKVMSLFQMEKQSGIQGIAAMKPTSVDDLAILNSVIRLMAQEKGGEIPTHKLARFKADPSQWDDELREYGLGEDAKKVLEPVVGISYGLCIAQEQFMQLVQLPEFGGFSLTWADKLRKSIAKKNPAEYEKLTKEFFEVTKEKGCDQKLCSYVWNVQIAMSRGYGFNQSHTLAYSLIGLQELNLAYRFPIIFWNCACLISDSGGTEEGLEDNGEYGNLDERAIWNDEFAVSMVDFGNDDDEEDDDEDDEEVTATTKTTKKKKAKATNYGKIAAAIGKMKMGGIDVAPPDINKSKFTFTPDVEHNIILHGMSGITKVGSNLIQTIMESRPYASMNDFLTRVKVTKPQMVNLIKSGCFDCFGERTRIMDKYLRSVSDQKKRVTLQNMKMMIDFGLIPKEFDLQARVYNYNKYLKKFKSGSYYLIPEVSYPFYERHFNLDFLIPNDDAESGFAIQQTTWDKIYQGQMDIIRPWVKENSAVLLKAINDKLVYDTEQKYATGNISKWEMDSVSYYAHDHELENLDYMRYGFSNYFNLPEEPEIDRIIPTRDGKKIPLLKIHRIAGTVLDRDKAKKMVTLLTKEGVVTVKIFGDVFTHYDRQLSAKGADGKKHVYEKSWFSRGNKIIVTGIKRDDQFFAKKYKNTPFHLVSLITDIDEDGTLTIQEERMMEEE